MSAVNARRIILAPVVSEKSYMLNDQNVFTFEVAIRANKVQIRQAIEEIFDVTVVKVNTMNRKGKRKRNRFTRGFDKRSDRKRALVTLAEGDTIDVFGS